MNKRITYPLLFMIVAFSCNKPKSLDQENYKKWIKNEKNGITKEKIINRIKYIVQFQPVDLLLLKSKETKVDSTSEKIRMDYENVLAFTMEITDTSGNYSMLRYELGHENEYYDRLNYYGNLIQKDLYVVDGNDTLPCQFSHMENTYNVSPINTLTLEFLRKTKNKEYNNTFLVYNDRVFNNGLLKFYFKKEDLNNIPKLKI